MDIISGCRGVGTFRGAAQICGTTHKTVARVVATQEAGEARSPKREARERSYDVVADVLARRVGSSGGRISAKRLLAVAQAAGDDGSARNFRRLVAKSKAHWRRDR